MQTVDVWETVAAIAMHVERAKAAASVAGGLGAFSVAQIVFDMDRAASALHRIETERANGVRTEARKRALLVQETRAVGRLKHCAKTLWIELAIEDMGYVTLTAGAYRLGCLPMKAGR